MKNKKSIFTILLFIAAAVILWFVFQPAEKITAFNLKEIAVPKIKNPAGVVKHKAYTLEYNEKYEQPEWVAYILTKSNLRKPQVKRKNYFRRDTSVAAGSAAPADYKNSGYDRGHLAPAADMTFSDETMRESFFMSNISPQTPGFNRGIWKKLESEVRNWAILNDTLLVVTGPILTDITGAIGKNKVGTPKYFYKAVIDLTYPEFKGIGFILPNESSSKPLSFFSAPIDSIEKITGIDFFYKLPDQLENKLESENDFYRWSSK